MVDISKIDTHRINGLEVKADDEAVVHITGDETISGNKIFTDPVTFDKPIDFKAEIEFSDVTKTVAPDLDDISDSIPTTEWVDDFVTQALGEAAKGSIMTLDTDQELNGAKTFNNVVTLNGSNNTSSMPSTSTSTTSEQIATVGWVNDPTKSTNVVHRSGNETISGFKTIENNIFLKDTQGTIGTSTNQWARRIQFTDSTGTRIARLEPAYVDETTLAMGMYASNGTTTENGIWVRNTGETYAPHPATAQDSSNKIATTAWVNNLDNSVVHKTGNETISGTKTFNSALYVGSTTSNRTQVGGSAIEFIPLTTSTHGGYIDFHYAGSTKDYTSRIIEDKEGNLNLVATSCTAPTPTETTTSSKQIATVGWVNSNTVHLTGDETIDGVKTFKQVIQGTAYRAYWADLAEKYKSDVKYLPGTLIQFGGEKEITIATSEVNGVVSEKPGFILNKEERGTLVALSGQVRLRLIGKINKFDRIVLSEKSGIGRAKKWYEFWKPVIAIALDSNKNEKEKLVKCVTKLKF